MIACVCTLSGGPEGCGLCNETGRARLDAQWPVGVDMRDSGLVENFVLTGCTFYSCAPASDLAAAAWRRATTEWRIVVSNWRRFELWLPLPVVLPIRGCGND